jgi:hypothetical protein
MPSDWRYVFSRRSPRMMCGCGWARRPGGRPQIQDILVRGKELGIPTDPKVTRARRDDAHRYVDVRKRGLLLGGRGQVFGPSTVGRNSDRPKDNDVVFAFASEELFGGATRRGGGRGGGAKMSAGWFSKEEISPDFPNLSGVPPAQLAVSVCGGA